MKGKNNTHGSGVYMTVSCLQCGQDGPLLRLFILPGPKSDGWDLGACVQLEFSIARRHDGGNFTQQQYRSNN